MKLVNGLDRWIIALTDGQQVSIWADAFSRAENGDYVFAVLIERDADDEPGLERAVFDAETPSNPLRSSLVVATIPASSVASVRSQ